MKSKFYFAVVFSVGCQPQNELKYKGSTIKENEIMNLPMITSVEILQNKVVISGKNLQNVKDIKIQNQNKIVALKKDEKTSSDIKLQMYLVQSIAITLDKISKLIISDALGKENILNVKFTLGNGSVTANLLSDMGAIQGDVLMYNADLKKWEPKALTGLNYRGTWDAAKSIEGENEEINAGDYWIVSKSGNFDLSGVKDWKIGDWAIYNGKSWQKINNSTEVLSFAGRKGNIVPENNDYTWSQINKENSKIADISDVDVTNISVGDVLKWNGEKWVTASDDTVNAQSASNSDLTAHVSNTSNPHSVTATQIGLGNVNNTSDADKPISTLTQAALDLKINSTTYNTHVNNTNNPHSVTAAQIGLGNVNNTSDVDKPISTLTQAALDTKLNKPTTWNAGRVVFHDSADFGEDSRFFWDKTNGRLGVGTSTPATTLDVNGLLKIAKNSTEPVVCDANSDQVIALTANYQTCVCRNGTGWVLTKDGSSSCYWSAVTIVNYGAGRRWSDDTYAKSCLDYKNSSVANHVYTGVVGDGVYTIDPDGAGSLQPFEAYCDMTTDNGGWTLILNYLRGLENPNLVVKTTTLPLLGDATLGIDESNSLTTWGHASNSLMANFLDITETRFYCKTTAHPRVMHFKTNSANVVTNIRTGLGNYSSITTSPVLLAGHTAIILTQSLTFSYVNQGNYTLTNFPFWHNSSYHWSLRGGGSGYNHANSSAWLCDDVGDSTNQDTFHQVWVR